MRKFESVDADGQAFLPWLEEGEPGIECFCVSFARSSLGVVTAHRYGVLSGDSMAIARFFIGRPHLLHDVIQIRCASVAEQEIARNATFHWVVDARSQQIVNHRRG